MCHRSVMFSLTDFFPFRDVNEQSDLRQYGDAPMEGQESEGSSSLVVSPSTIDTQLLYTATLQLSQALDFPKCTKAKHKLIGGCCVRFQMCFIMPSLLGQAVLGIPLVGMY